MRADPELVAKYEAEESEWRRLAEQATHPTVASMCQRHALYAGNMLRFWKGK